MAYAATDLNLTTAWNVNVAYEHFWNPSWRTSLYGGYAAVSYNATAMANCLRFLAQRHATLVRRRLSPGCDMDWSTWWLGSRTQWNITKDFYMGFDVLYAKLDSASTLTA